MNLTKTCPVHCLSVINLFEIIHEEFYGTKRANNGKAS